MELFEQIRREHEHDTGTIQGVAKKLGIHRRMVREALANAVPRERKTAVRRRLKLALAIAFIEAIVEADQKAPRKQRHTAHRIWCRIRAEMPEVQVCESTIRRYVRKRKMELRRAGPEPFVPQSYRWGSVRRAEGGYFRRNHSVPVPKVASWEELDVLLWECSRNDEQRITGERTETVDAGMVLEREHLRPLKEGFDLAAFHYPKVNASRCVRVLTNFYSAPLPVGLEVQVKVQSAYVQIWHQGECVAGGFFFQSQMHPFMTTILLGMSRLNPFDPDSKP